MKEFEMPCSCQRCGELFDLHDGRGSEKWYPNTVICESCGRDEEQEIETDTDLEELVEGLNDALYTVFETSNSIRILLEKRKDMGITEDPDVKNPRKFSKQDLEKLIY